MDQLLVAWRRNKTIYESTGSSLSNLRVVPIFSMRFIAQTKLSKLDLVRDYLSVVPGASLESEISAGSQALRRQA